jgi:hypothetical protein
MFDNIFRSFRAKSSGREGDFVDVSTEAVFMLVFGNLPILVLARNPNGWTMRYTEEFKNQHTLAPLVPFPDVNKNYQTAELWPFFAVRIPSIARPEVKRTVREEKLNYDDVAAMLRRFGRKSIADPFELRPQAKKPR